MPSTSSHATLADLSVGQSAILGKAQAFTPVVLRLVEMGMVPGAAVTMRRMAPLRDPLEIDVNGTRVCLRKADAALFVVETGTHVSEVEHV